MIEIRKEISPTEAVAAATAISTVGAMLFQIGLIGPTGASTLSILTLQDILLGAAVCLPLIFLGAAMSVLIYVMASRHPVRRGIFLVSIAAICGVATTVLIEVISKDTGPSVGVALLVFFAMSVGVIANMNIEKTVKVATILVISLCLPFGLGNYYSWIARDESRPNNAVVKTKEKEIAGRMLANTTNYILLITDGELVVTPVKDVVEFRRILGVR